MLKADGIKEDIINAVIENKKFNNLLMIKRESAILNKYIHTKKGTEIVKTYKRLNNVIEKEDGNSDVKKYKFNKKLFLTKEEIDLYREVIYQKGSIRKLVKENKFEESLDNLYDFSYYVNNFMNNTKINDNINKGLCKNRLSLVRSAFCIFNIVTDFSKIKKIHISKS
ncbi:MAG: DALR anticodon-binding domain-containing protein [Ehrlichia sp.]